MVILWCIPQLPCKSFNPWRDLLPPLTQRVLTVTAQALLPKAISVLCYWSKEIKSLRRRCEKGSQTASPLWKSLKTSSMCPHWSAIEQHSSLILAKFDGKVTLAVWDYTASRAERGHKPFQDQEKKQQKVICWNAEEMRPTHGCHCGQPCTRKAPRVNLAGIFFVCVTGYFITTLQIGYKVHLRNVSTFFQEETFSATLSTPHLPHSYLLLSCSPWSLSGDLLFGFVCFWECLLVPERREKTLTKKLKRWSWKIKS